MFQLKWDHRIVNPKEFILHQSPVTIVEFQLKYKFIGLKNISNLFLFLTTVIILTLKDTKLRDKTMFI